MGLHSVPEVFIIESGGGAGLPTYDYRCTKCGDEFAVEQSIKDKPLARCRKCRGKLEKLLPRSLSLIFKGSGFYVTDYRKPETKGKKPASRKHRDTSPDEGPSSTKPAEEKTAKEKPGNEGTT